MQELANAVSLSVDVSLRNSDFESLKKSINYVTGKEDFDFVALIEYDSTTTKNTVFVHSPKDFPISKILHPNLEIYNLKASPINNADLSGKIVIGALKSKMEKEVNELNYPFYIILIYFLNVSLLVMYIISEKIGQPFKKIIQHMNSLGEGEYKLEIEVGKSAKEYQSVNTSLIILRDNLNELKSENDSIKENLQFQVNSRTKELLETSSRLNNAQVVSKSGDFSYRVDEKTFSFSENFLRILNLSHTTSQKTIRSLLKQLNRRNLDELLVFFRTASQSKNRFEKDIYLVNNSGTFDFSWILIVLEFEFNEFSRPSILRGTIQDISSRKSIQIELERTSIVAQKTSNAVIITDASKKIVWCNAAVKNITGYSMDDLLGLTPRIFQFEKTSRETINQINEAISNQHSIQVEILNKGKYGNEYWLELNIVPMFNVNDELSGYIAVETDITRLKHQQQELAEFNEIQNFLLETSNNLLSNFKIDFKIFYQESIKKLLKISKLNSSGLYFNTDNQGLRLVHAESSTHKHIFPSFLNIDEYTSKTVLEGLNFDKKQKKINEDQIVVLEIGNPEKNNALMILLDESTEKKLLKFKDLLQLYAQILSNFIERSQYVHDLIESQHEIKIINESLELKILENTRENLKLSQTLINQDKLAILGEVSSSVAHELNTPLSSLKGGLESITDLIKDLLSNNNSKFDINQVESVLAMLEDLTLPVIISDLQKLKNASIIKQEISKSFKIEENQSAELAFLLARCNLSMPESTKIINHLLSSTLPDQRLAYVKFFYDVQLIYRMLRIMGLSIEKCITVVKNVQKITSKETIEKKTVINLKKNIETVLNVLSYDLLGNLNIQFNSPDNIELLGYETRLFQVWLNIIKNAMEAMNNKENSILKIVVSSNVKEHQVTITNNGPMIRPEHHSQIFNYFTTTKSDKTSSGLGLRVVKNVLESHFAKIHFESNEQETSFIVIFPILNE